MNMLKKTLLSVFLVLALLPQVPAQNFLFDQTMRDVQPGELFSLQVSVNTGPNDINLWLLYLNTSSDESVLTVTGATLDPMWEYFGDPAWPVVIPAAPANSGELGLAFPAGPGSIAAGTWQLTTLTLQVSEMALPGSFQLMTTPDSAFYDSADNEFFPTAAILNLNVVPEPSAFVLVLAAAAGSITLVRSRRQLQPPN